MAAGAVLETLEQQVLRLQLVEPVVELETKVRKDFTITEKAPTRALSWLKALRHY